MKELPIEEKAKRYDEAFKRAKEKYAMFEGMKQGDVLEDVFPELKGNRDEKMMNQLHSWMKEFGGADEYAEKVYCWLKELIENQGEKIPCDKAEPKFKVGDWIKHNKANIICKIVSVNRGSYYMENIETNSRIEFFHAEQNFHLWTIQDAKDGDVLVNGSNIFIFHFINDTRLIGYCHVNTVDGRFYDDIGKNECFCRIDAVVNPATKEQRDFLFQKMKEVGYEWDTDKKELLKRVLLL